MTSSCRRPLAHTRVLLCVLLLGWPSKKCEAQSVGDIVGKLFASFEHVAIAPELNWLSSDDVVSTSKTGPVWGGSIGVGWHLTRIGVGKAKCQQHADPVKKDSLDLVRVEVEVTDSTKLTRLIKEPHPIPKPVIEKCKGIDVDLSLSYRQITGFHGQSSLLELAGGVEELPSLGLTFTWSNLLTSTGLYGTFRSGLTNLKSFRAQPDGGTLITAGGSAQLFAGTAIGAYTLIRPISASPFAELAYTSRRFNNVEWGKDGTTIPASVPRRLDLSTWSLSFGLDIVLPPRFLKT